MAAKDVQKYKHNKPWYVVQHPGKPTAKHTKLVSLPIAYLLTLPGMRDEHKVLTFETPKVRRMIDICSDREWQRKNPVTLNVLADGRVIIEDGNHRIRAAKLGGKDTFLCKIVYYGGGEEHFDLEKILEKYAGIGIEQFMTVVAAVKKPCRGLGCNTPTPYVFCDPCTVKSKSDPNFQKKPAGVDMKNSPTPSEQKREMKERVKDNFIKGLDSIHKADFQGISGDGEVDGEAADGEYAEMHDSGVNYGGENDPNKDDERTMIPGQTDGTRAALEALSMFAKYAAVMAPPMGNVAAPPKPSFWERLKPHHQKIMHTLINQLYTPGYDDVNPEDNNPWNLEPGQRLANLIRAALASDEVLEALVQIASSNRPCKGCGNPTDQCICLSDTNMSAGYTQDGTQRKNNPIKTQKAPKGLNPSTSLGKL